MKGTGAGGWVRSSKINNHNRKQSTRLVRKNREDAMRCFHVSVHAIPGSRALPTLRHLRLPPLLMLTSLIPEHPASAATLQAAMTAAHTGQLHRVLHPPKHFQSTSYQHGKTVTKQVTVECQWQVNYQTTEPEHDHGVPRAVTARCTYGPQQVASSKPHLSKATRSYMANIQRCCIHGKLQLRNRLLWCQNVVLIQVF